MRLVQPLFAVCLLLLVMPARGDAVADAEGLWEYTGLITRDGQSLPLTGVFLIANDVFLQQSIFDGEPFARQGSMAHVGPYWGGGAGLRLRSDQTLSMEPGADAPLRSAGALEHDLTVSRDGDELTLVFSAGEGTVQTFQRLGDGRDTRLYQFADGALAFTDDYFILVIGDEREAVTGYGGYRQAGDVLVLDAVRWAASNGERVLNLRDAPVSVRFDEKTLTLPGGRVIPVLERPGENHE